MKPSVALDLKRAAVREAASRFHTANPRIFGSVLHGVDEDGSDLDLLVDALPGQRCSIWVACNSNSKTCWVSMSMY